MSRSESSRHERALIVADAAFNVTEDALRGRDLPVVWSTPTQVSVYLPIGS